jgi:hypothetical protein
MSSMQTACSPRIPWWLWINVLSLDAPLLAVVWQAALAKVHHVTLMPGCHIALGLAVWVVYMVDRVLDSFGKENASLLTARHAFYLRHRRLYGFVIIPLVTIWMLKCALFDIPAGLLGRGLELGFVVILYLLHYTARKERWLYLAGNAVVCSVGFAFLFMFPVPVPLRTILGTVILAVLLLSISKKVGNGPRLLPKELVCALVFATGCSLSVSYHLLDSQSLPGMAAETLLLALLCFLNCVAIASYERRQDACNDPNAITQTWPRLVRLYPAMLAALMTIALIALAQQLPVEVSRYTWSVLVSAILLAGLHFLSKRISSELSHVLADAALITPVVMLAMK